ncbi:DUF4381 domain-containing protein [Alteromonas pelagimontana]|uniref:DUF4381 domain-containing protein n=1 Tax=Alteromonas pelagimontana TaxID=1858656 RepID=A0A6M4MAP1_9ALTE|nr:DUF4381 domain-containing protein [Alteromonas pelagimontana]QJR79868.1 DUF4381 domain-containing protein [Alteromonas pelagimontana]
MMQSQLPPESAQNPLAQLKDVHVPEDVYWWPLAWGWWLLAVLILALLVYVVVWWKKRRQLNRARRYAMEEARHIDSRQEDWPAKLNGILKRTAQSYFSNDSVSGLYGQRWQKFLLNRISEKPAKHNIEKGLDTLQSMLYQPTPASAEKFPVCQKAVLQWLKKANLQQKRAGNVMSNSEVNHV